MSLKKSFFFLTFCGLLLSLALSLLLWRGCDAIISQYPAGGIVVSTNGVFTPLPSPTPEQLRLRTALELIRLTGCVLFPVLGLGVAATLFYRWKLKNPISLLLEGTRRIQAHDLDFSIPKVPQDELGQVCAAFETMRQELLKTNRELWRQAEERKRLNAAFSHDLRNPITVLKGSVKLLRQNGADTAALDRLETYTVRIEQYVEAMSGIQRLEQIPVRYTSVPCAALREELEETARLLAPALKRKIMVPETGSMQIDHGLFLTVAENLIGNAARFAKSELSAALTLADGRLCLSVLDDGPGFPAALLKSGPKPFGKAEEQGEHFGMGLYGSKLLCQKHGGNLLLENTAEGGAAVTAFFQLNLES